MPSVRCERRLNLFWYAFITDGFTGLRLAKGTFLVSSALTLQILSCLLKFQKHCPYVSHRFQHDKKCNHLS